MKHPVLHATLAAALVLIGAFIMGVQVTAAATPVFINELHYDNTGTDSGEAIEILGPAGSDLAGWKIVRYNGANGQVYTTPAANPAGSDTLSGYMPDLGGGYGVIVVNYLTNGIQNGSPDGIALVDNGGAVVQFLSYEGAFTASNGPANGLGSTDIGVSEDGAGGVGQSLQLQGSGSGYEDFTWTGPGSATFGAINTAQVLTGGVISQLLISEIVVTPTAGEFIEIYNPNVMAVDLSDVYLTDATFSGSSTYYYNIVTGANAGGGGFSDFHARFPAGATIAAGEYQTVALNGSDNFFATYGVAPTYELYEDGASPDAVPDMREALPGLIHDQGGLTNDGEVVILYRWNGESDRVTDLDYVVWGDKAEAVDKTGVSVDGPDADAVAGDYLADTAISLQDVVAAGAHAIDDSWQRADAAEGSEIHSGGNGAGGHDETSEDLGDTWCETDPTPNAASACQLICGTPATPIHDIQGSGPASGKTGETHVIEGVVVGDFQGADELKGFFVQEEDSDADGDPATSEGIFAFDNGFGVEVQAGDVVRVAGTVAEHFGFTRIENVTGVRICGGGAVATPAALSLPLPESDFPERYEGMAVSVAQELTVTETFTLGRYGEVMLSSGGRLMEPTAVVPPGAAANARQAQNDLARILLDDGSDVQNPDPIVYPPPELSAANTLRGGDRVQAISGVLGYNYQAYRIHPTAPVTFLPANPRPAVVPPVGGRLKAASFSLGNYFTTIDSGADICGPGANLACRGADSAAEFTRQRDKLLAALAAIAPDVLALTELENNAEVTIQDLVDGLNAIAGSPVYDYIDTGSIGADAIRNAIVYKPSAVSPVGAYAVLDQSVDPTFLVAYHRPSLAQTFEENATRDRFTVAVNHFKSKGSSCDALGDPDAGDGQSNCNLTRVAAATALVNWLAGDPTGSGDPDFLILGDMNTYAMEDPLTVFESAGYGNLVRSFAGTDAYAFAFDGQWGYLEHALASATFIPKVTGAAFWHINADEPWVLNYNMEFKNADQLLDLYSADAYRSSDHDPLVVGLDLDDGDGVDPAVEDGAPNGGDGNDDGIRDSQQANVASIADGHGGYVTAEVSGACSLIGTAELLTEASLASPDPDYEYPFGLMRLGLACSEADLRLIYHRASGVMPVAYRNYGPTPPGYLSPYWYHLPGVAFETVSIGGTHALAAKFKLFNGRLGDDTDASDGRIVSLGGPGLLTAEVGPAKAVPAVDSRGLGLLALLVFCAGLWAVGRMKPYPPSR